MYPSDVNCRADGAHTRVRFVRLRVLLPISLLRRRFKALLRRAVDVRTVIIKAGRLYPKGTSILFVLSDVQFNPTSLSQ